MKNVLDQLYHSGLQFLVPLTPDETYKTLINEAVKIIGAAYGTILLWENDSWEKVYSTVPNSQSITPRKNGYTKATFRKGEILVLPAKDVVRVHPELEKMKMKRTVMVPLSYQNDAYGILILAVTNSRKISQRNLELLKVYGAIASLSIRKMQLYSEAKKAIEARDIFLGLVAHELRTPLTTITSYVQFLEKKEKRTKKIVPQWIKELSFSTLLLKKLVNELLNVDLLESGKFTYSIGKVRLEQVIEEAIRQYEITNPSTMISFSNYMKRKNAFIAGDMKRLIQALDNLFDNAEKFSKKSTEISISLRKKSKEYVIQVKDNGIGVPKEHIGKLFRPFYKAHQGYQEGMGLGLFLSKSIIQQHHGDIHVNSKEKLGTTVTIRLPQYHE